MHKLNSTKVCLLLTALLVTLIMLGGCSREGENIPTAYPTITSEMQTGWDSFKKAQYTNAITYFTNAKDRNAEEIDAYNGLGWSYAREGNYNKSKQNYMLMLSLTDDKTVHADGNAGLAYNYFATPLDLKAEDVPLRDSIAIVHAVQALALDSNYQFAHDANINAKSLHILIAECHFNRQKYLEALTKIEADIEPGFTDALLQSGVIKEVKNDSIKVVDSKETPLTGRARLIIEKQLVKVNAVTSLDQLASYIVDSFVESGNEIVFRGNPIPQKGDFFLVSYYYAPNYGEFLATLMQKLQDF